MKFKYQARTKSGEMQVGFVESVSREAALNVLQGNELYVLSLASAERRSLFGSLASIFERVRQYDLMIFTRQFATLLSAQIALSDSLRSLQRQTKNAILKDVIFELASDVDAGLSLSQALERHPNIFSIFYVNMVRSAEVSGRLEETMGYLADYLENQVGIITRIRNALIYPAMLVLLSFGVAAIMITVVFPSLRPVFEEANVQLPFYTRWLFSMGDFLAAWWWAVLIFLGLAAAFIADYFRSDEGRVVYDELRTKIPIIGNLFRKLYVARFADATGVLVKGGIPVAQAIEISAHTIDNQVYRDMLHEAAEAVRRGELISQALEKNEFYFPPLVSQMISVGEATGRLEEMLRRISQFYVREVDNLVANLVELIQPIMIVGIGVIVGLLFASVLLPIYNLTQSIGDG